MFSSLIRKKVLFTLLNTNVRSSNIPLGKVFFLWNGFSQFIETLLQKRLYLTLWIVLSTKLLLCTSSVRYFLQIISSSRYCDKIVLLWRETFSAELLLNILLCLFLKLISNPDADLDSRVLNKWALLPEVIFEFGTVYTFKSSVLLQMLSVIPCQR